MRSELLLPAWCLEDGGEADGVLLGHLLVRLLLLQCGDVEPNPGPPRRNPVPTGPPKKDGKEVKEEKEIDMGAKVKDYEEKIYKLEKHMEVQRQEIESLKNKMKNLEGVDEKLLHMNAKIEAITGVYDDLHEKMHEIDKTRENNLLFYGIKPDFLPEIPIQLEQKIHEMIKVTFNISRDVPISRISRMLTGPEVRGCRPVLVNFVHWKDREEVLRKSSLLRGSHIYITEDLSRKMREHRQELGKYARQIRSRSPNKKCSLRQDKLFVDNHMFVYDEERHEVVRFARPQSPNRVPSRNYSAVDDVMRRSTSVPSVNGDANGGDHGFGSPRPMPPNSASSSVGPGGGRSSSGGGGPKYSSTESLVHLADNNNQHQLGDSSHSVNVAHVPKFGGTILENEETEDEELEKDKVVARQKLPPPPPAAAPVAAKSTKRPDAKPKHILNKPEATKKAKEATPETKNDKVKEERKETPPKEDAKEVEEQKELKKEEEEAVLAAESDQ